MIKIKILEKKGGRFYMKHGIDDFINALGEIVDYPLEIVEHTDPNFNGYYIMPYEEKYNETLFNKHNQHQIFLLGVVNPSIQEILNQYDPVGLMQWRLFRAKTTSIFASNLFLKNNNIKLDGIKGSSNYTSYINVKRDGTYLKTAMAIVKHLELYDKWKNNSSHTWRNR
jgi:hypothetical protein